MSEDMLLWGVQFALTIWSLGVFISAAIGYIPYDQATAMIALTATSMILVQE